MVSTNVMLAQDPQTPQEEDLIIMNEKVVNPIGEHGSMPKSLSFLYIYQSGHVFTFGDDHEGCEVSLLSNDTTVFSTVVDANGQVIVPSVLSGEFELQLTVGGVTYWAEVLL